MFPTPASVRWSRIAAFTGARRFGEPRGELLRAERRIERLGPDARVEIRIELPGLEQEPGAEAPDVAVGDVRSIV